MAPIDFIKIAQRGFSGSYPENTRVAFEKAIEAGVDMISIDCQLSKDNHVVVIQDELLDRTAGVKGLVYRKSLKQLRRLDVGVWFRKPIRGQNILTLEEVLEIVQGKVGLNLAIRGMPQGASGVELRILFVLSYYDYREKTIFSSFNYSVLRRLRELSPESRIGIPYTRDIQEDPFKVADELHAHSLHVSKRMVTSAFISKAEQLGLEVFVWTVNDVKEMQRLLSLGVKGIFSSHPERFIKIAAGEP